MNKDEIDTTNKFHVSVRGDHIVVLNPPREPITNEDARLLAAWLVALTGGDGDEWKRTFFAVMHT